MRPAAVPSIGLPPLTRSVAACIAAILEIETDDVPQLAAGHGDPWLVWRQWLATRGLGLVPVAEPASFSWPGPWIALLDPLTTGSTAPRPAHAELVATIAFGVPPGLVWKPLGGPETFASVVAGYVIAPSDPALWLPRAEATTRIAGRVEAIAVARAAEAPMQLVDTATATAGRGLAGDRYADGRGTFSREHARGTDLTLIEVEEIERLALPSGELGPADARRNVITRGIDLNALVGRRFFVGDVECLGQRLCEPCSHLERLTAPGVLRGLVHRGGLRADILRGGAIQVGDVVRGA